MNDNNTKSKCNHRSLSSTNSARRLQTEHYLCCEPACSYYLRATAVNGLHLQEQKNTCRCCDPSSAQDLSRTASRLLTTVMSHSHAPNTCTHKNFKIQGTQHRLEYYPSSSHNESVHPGSLTGREQIFTKAALKFTGSWGSWGSEVPKSAWTPHLPNELDPLLDSLIPLVTCSKVGTLDKRPMDE